MSALNEMYWRKNYFVCFHFLVRVGHFVRSFFADRKAFLFKLIILRFQENIKIVYTFTFFLEKGSSFQVNWIMLSYQIERKESHEIARVTTGNCFVFFNLASYSWYNNWIGVNFWLCRGRRLGGKFKLNKKFIHIFI